VNTTTLTVSPAQIAAAVGVLVAGIVLWRSGRRRARATAEAARASVRLLSLAGRVVFTAGLIVGVQWIVMSQPGRNGWVVLGVLGLPALFSAFALVRALTVTTMDTPRSRRGGRR
jgi:hypothetical protein